MNIKQNDGCNCALENGKIPYQAEILSISNFFQLYFLTQQFFFLIYFLVEGKLLYNLVLVSAIQHEAAIGKHTSPPFFNSSLDNQSLDTE